MAIVISGPVRMQLLDGKAQVQEVLQPGTESSKVHKFVRMPAFMTAPAPHGPKTCLAALQVAATAKLPPKTNKMRNKQM